LLNLSSYHESRHHEAQALLQSSMNMNSQAQQQMNDHQSLIQEQRHQAEMSNQKKKFESQLREERRPVVEEPKEKRLIVTRSIAEAVQQDYTEGGSSGSTDVPMAIAPPSTTKKTSEDVKSGEPTKASAGVEIETETKTKGVKNTKLKPDNRKPDNVTTQKIEGKSKSWWLKQNIASIKAQAELRGIRFTDAQTKGEKGSYGNSSTPKFKKQDYLNELYKLLGI
jgi:hypothetical protein